MIKHIIALLFPVLTWNMFAQGIEFQHISLEDAMVKAKVEDKLVFIDFYTVWCAPCRNMALRVFTNDEVGKLFNKEFINIKLDAEKEGLSAARKYRVNAFPTFVFVNADGEMSYRKVGSMSIENTIKVGKEALASTNNNLSLTVLQNKYKEKQNDETFLKVYIRKMIEFREDPTDAIDKWLRIQTEIKEKDAEMMEFLFDHSAYLHINSKAEEILTENYEEFFDIATRDEEKKLTNLKNIMLKNTGETAYRTKNPVLLQSYVDRMKTYPVDKQKDVDYAKFEIDQSLFRNDIASYKKKTVDYMNKLIGAKTIDQIHSSDKLLYEDYRDHKYAPSLSTNQILKKYEKGIEALSLIQKIERNCLQYMQYSDNKSDYKYLKKWMDYGAQLIPEDYDMDNLRAKVLYKEGNKKDALKYKESALHKIPQSDKHYSVLKSEFEKMKLEIEK